MADQSKSQESGSLKVQWPERAAQLVVETTDAVREKGISPIYRLTRWIIYGLLGIGLAMVVGTLMLVGLVRLLTVYAFASHVWITYLVLGLIFTVLGFLLWSKRLNKAKEQ